MSRSLHERLSISFVGMLMIPWLVTVLMIFSYFIVCSLYCKCLLLYFSEPFGHVQDPCTPLVTALFIVVGMSLANVVQFFSKIKSRQGFYAVALLSLNWFMLGTLAYPALPFIGQIVSAVFWSFAARVISFVGFGAIKATTNLHLEALSEF